MQLSDFQFIKLTNEMTIPTFHCKDEDLNSFLLDDAKKYINDLMAATYLFVELAIFVLVAVF